MFRVQNYLIYFGKFVDFLPICIDNRKLIWYNLSMTNKVMKTNRYNQQLVDCGTHWAIVTPLKEGNPSGLACNCHHTGSEKYIKNIWNKKFTIIYFICPVTRCKATIAGKPNIDQNMLV